MNNMREIPMCVFCNKSVNEKGRIQFDKSGDIIGCCEECFGLAQVFVNNGRRVRPKKEEV